MCRSCRRPVASSILVLLAVFASLPARAQDTQLAASQERLASIRIHGNYATPDQDVLTLAGLVVGEPLTDAILAEAQRRLDSSGRFDRVEIRKRYQSLSDPAAVALVIVVQEREGATPEDPLPSPLRRVTSRLMFLPILTFEDGYNFTYGGRITFADSVGKGGRLTIPLTWGGTRQAAIEADRPFAAGPISRVRFGASIHRRENPYYEIGDRREEGWAEISALPVRFVQLGARASYAFVRFGETGDHLATFGASVTFDTRRNASFPRNALLARVAWDALRVDDERVINRIQPDVQAYVGLVRSSIVVLRVQASLADRTLPPYEQALLGGMASLRGFRAGHRIGDSMLAGTLEFRVPLNSPMRFANTGLRIFADTGTTWNHGERLEDARTDTGVGAGWFIVAPLFRFGIDVAQGLDSGTRAHVQFGITF